MASVLGCQFVDSRSSNVRVQVDRADQVERRVARWALVRDFRLRERPRHVLVLVRRSIVVRVSVIRVRVASKKDR